MVFKPFSLKKGKPFFNETGGYKVALVRGARFERCLLRSTLGTRDVPQSPVTYCSQLERS